MMALTESIKVYLHREPVDFRKQINGLSVLVQEGLSLDPYSESLFVFTNRLRNRIKILYWQRNGFCLWQKRLERDRFIWSKQFSDELIIVNGEQLDWLLSGLDIWRQPAHTRIHFDAVT